MFQQSAVQPEPDWLVVRDWLGLLLFPSLSCVQVGFEEIAPWRPWTLDGKQRMGGYGECWEASPLVGGWI
jgi:hypothetical protein